MPIFNPNQPMDPDEQMALLAQQAMAQPNPAQFNFETRAQAIEARKRALADAMRRKAANQMPQMPKGEMVSGHFVGPHWTQMLTAAAQPALAQMDVTAQARALQRQTAEYSQADSAAGAAHQARMPVARQEQLAGPPEEGAAPPTRTVKPTTQERMQWAQEGMGIPSRREVLSRLMGDLMVEEPVREEQRTFRAQESEAQRQAQVQMNRERLEQRAQEAEQRAADAKASREERAAAQREANELRREIARESNETRRALIAAQVDRASAPKPVPQSIMKELGEAQDRAASMGELVRTFSPDYSGLTMGARTRAGSYLGTDADAVEWWKNYRKQSELTERHALFGASLTAGEQAAWASADIGPMTDPKVIQRNLATRAKLAAKVYATQRERAIRSGYKGVADAFDEPATAPTREGGATGSWDAAPVIPNGWTVKTR
jgi:hypothetical protein